MRTPPRILIVDDTPANVHILQTRLAAHGYDIVTALGPDESAAALADAGATWLIDGPAPDEAFAAVQARVGLGPPR